MPKADDTRLTVRLPKDVYSSVKATAQLERTSMNAIIVNTLSKPGVTYINNQYNIHGDVNITSPDKNEPYTINLPIRGWSQ